MAALFFDTPQPTVDDTLRRLSPEGTGDDSLVFRQMISQQLRVHMSVALSCVLSKPGRLMPPRSYAVLIPLIEHLGGCARMGLLRSLGCNRCCVPPAQE
eukprot:4406630-Pleurochrysis_carterae.AAC.2